MGKSDKKPPKRNYAPKVSLAPLSFEQAISGFLQVKPDPKPAGAAKAPSKKRGVKKG